MGLNSFTNMFYFHIIGFFNRMRIGWIIQVFFLSILFIWLMHQLLAFLTNTLTVVPKRTPDRQYREMMEILANGKERQAEGCTDLELLPPSSSSSSYSSVASHDAPSSPCPSSNEEDMKNELKQFLQTKLH